MYSPYSNAIYLDTDGCFSHILTMNFANSTFPQLPDLATEGTQPHRISRYAYEMSRQAPLAAAFEHDANGESYKIPMTDTTDMAAIFVRSNQQCFMFYASPRMPHALCCKLATSDTRHTPDGHTLH